MDYKRKHSGKMPCQRKRYSKSGYIATNVYVLDVENYVNALCKLKITAAVYAALGTDVKYLFQDLGASICAMYVIQADMSGFGSLREAETSLDVLSERIAKDEKIISTLDKTVWLGITT